MLMNGFDNFFYGGDSAVGNMDSSTSSVSRRRISKSVQQSELKNFSNQSMLHAMQEFVKTVTDMEDTIMVPCKLMDMKVGDETNPPTSHKTKKVIRNVRGADLYNIYGMLNMMKKELLMGVKASEMDDDTSSTSSQKTVKGHRRRPSTVSVNSTNSSVSCGSDSDSEGGSEGQTEDSGAEVDGEDCVQNVAANFRHHLVGLHESVKQLTNTAEYLMERYQSKIGGSM